MPENILGALFHLTKPYAGIAQDQKERHWRRRVSSTLAGTTLGILGLGAIGQELARKAEALEMRVIGTRLRPAPMPHVERVYGPADTDTVLAASDFVLLLLPVTPETRGFMNAARLKRMKPGAYLLNFGRGELIVDADLVEAVTAQTIAGAVLDVFTTEPLPAEHPFWGTEGIMVLPHIGGLHPRTRSRRGRALRRQPAALPRGPAPAGNRGPRARLLAPAMSRSLGSALPAELIARFSQTALPSLLGRGLPFVTLAADGTLHPMLCSYLEWLAADARTLRLAIAARSRSARNLAERGVGTLLLIEAERTIYVKCRAMGAPLRAGRACAVQLGGRGRAGGLAHRGGR